MTKKELADLYGKFGSFVEAFTAYQKESETMENVYEVGDKVKMDFYKVTFNDYEFMTFNELGKIHDLLGELLEKNNVNKSNVLSGRPNGFSDTTFDGMSLGL